MSYTASENTSLQFPGISSNNNSSATFDNNRSWQIALPAVAAENTGTLTTRSTDTNGVATLLTGHTILTADKVDVYWEGGQRYGMDATVAVDDVTIDAGAGDVLPITSTPMTLVKQTVVDDLDIEGANAQFVAVFYRNSTDLAADASIDMQDVSNVTVNQISLVVETENGGLDNISNIQAGDPNPYAGNPITQGHASHNSQTAATLFVLAGINSTP